MIRWPQRFASPTLSDVRRGEPDLTVLVEDRVFRRANQLQVVGYTAAVMTILTILIVQLLAHGWTLLSLILALVEVALLIGHGTPLVARLSRSLVISSSGISDRGLFRTKSIDWLEIQRFRAAEDLTRFSAEGILKRLVVDTSHFHPPTRLELYRVLRAHLAQMQRDIEDMRDASGLFRQVRAIALNVALLTVAIGGSLLLAPEVLPRGNVLGLRCAYASRYLTEKYGLPDRTGCVILRVNPGTGAFKAGLGEGDMIIAVEDVPITSGPQFTIFWESLEKREQRFTILRGRNAEPVTLKVSLGPRGKLPDYDPSDPYFFYLRARGAEDHSQAIRDFTKAIELDPAFDLAYVYRGALYGQANVPDLAQADLDKAVELDPELTEAYRERGWFYVTQARYDPGISDSQTALRLDRCETAFRTYNYDCYVNHLNLATAYGERGGGEDLTLAVAEVKAAIPFYPEEPRAYYLAAFYLTAQDRVEEARRYAERYLDAAAERGGEPDEIIEWADRLVNDVGFPDQAARAVQEQDRRQALYIQGAAEADIDAEGPAVVSNVLFTDKRTDQRPDGRRYLTPDRRQVWAYFEFDNAAGVETVFWEWSQNGRVVDVGAEPWLGTNKGYAWLLLENLLLNQDSESTLTVKFDQAEVAASTLWLRNDPFVGPLTFYTDPGATQPLGFYTGGPATLYASAEYVGALPQTTLLWVAEQNGTQLGTDVIQVSDNGTIVFPVTLSPEPRPGLVQVYLYLDGELSRTAMLAVISGAIAQAPPFTRFQTGLSADIEGRLATITKRISSATGGFAYVLDGISLREGSTLSVRWTFNGEPFGPLPESFTWPDPTRTFIGGVGGEDDYLAPGDYQVVISLDGEPVYADVVAVV